MSTQPQITKSRRFSLAPLIGALVPGRKRVAMTHHVRLLTEPIQFEEESLPSFVRVAMLALQWLALFILPGEFRASTTQLFVTDLAQERTPEELHGRERTPHEGKEIALPVCRKSEQRCVGMSDLCDVRSLTR